MDERATTFTVTGVANVTTYHAGITSTEAEKKRVKELLVFLTGHIGNKIELWLEQEKLAEYYDYHFVTDEATASTNVQKTTVRLARIPVNMEIPVGRTMKVALQCGATVKNLFGSYVFELV